MHVFDERFVIGCRSADKNTQGIEFFYSLCSRTGTHPSIGFQTGAVDLPHFIGHSPHVLYHMRGAAFFQVNLPRFVRQQVLQQVGSPFPFRPVLFDPIALVIIGFRYVAQRDVSKRRHHVVGAGNEIIPHQFQVLICIGCIDLTKIVRIGKEKDFFPGKSPVFQ